MRYNCLKNSGIEVVESIWTYPSTNFQITFKILSIYIINSYLEYSWLKNSAIWLTESIFDFTQLLIHKPTFMFLESITNYMPKIKSVLHFFSWYSSFKNSAIWLIESIFNHAKLKIYKTFFTFLESLSACHKSSWFIIFILKYSRFKNSAIWLAERILARNSKTRTLPGMAFVQAQS